jgi:hypothetical protein
VRLDLKENMFGVGVSIKEISWTLIRRKLFLFKRFFIPPLTCANPLAWWCIHEGQFPNVGFHAKQLLESWVHK